MKRLILLIAVIPVLSSAQQQPGFDPAQMQKMMEQYQDPAAMQKLQQQAESLQKCLEGIDDSQLEALRARAEAAGKEIEALCKAGKRAEALAKGLELSRELDADATVKKIRECSKEMSEMVQGMPGARKKGFDDFKAGKTPTEDDICS